MLPEHASGPSEVAQAIAALMPAIPIESVTVLRDLLSADLGAPAPTVVRERRLGLLAELIADGEWITQARYEAARAKRSEPFASADHLSDLFGGWDKVMAAATRLYFVGNARVPQDHRHAQTKCDPYSRQDVILAIRRARDDLGDWPTQWEYDTWARVRRQLARGSGKPDPRLPGLPQIRKKFAGSYPRALTAARGGT